MIGWAITVQARAELLLTGLAPEMAALVLPQTSLWQQPCDLNRWVVRYQYEQLEQEIIQALQTFGYYSPNINRSVILPQSSEQQLLKRPASQDASSVSQPTESQPQQPAVNDCWRVDVQVILGSPVRVRQMRLSIVPETPVLTHAPPPNLVPGQRFDHQYYEDFKTELERVAVEKGFFDAQFSVHEVLIHPEALAADISLEWSVGERYRFGTVTYSGALLDSDLLDRYLPFAPGDPYDVVSLGAFYQALLSSDYFADVTVDADVDHEVDRAVPVYVTVQPIKPTETQLGLGYSTDVGAKTSISHINKRVNNRGHRLEATLSLGERQSEIGGFYRLPDPHYAGGWTSVYSGINRIDTDTSKTTTSKVGVRQLELLGWNWIMTRYIELVSDDFRVAGADQQSTNLVPGVSFSRAFSDLSRRPRFGYRLGAGVSGTSRAIGSDTDFANVFVNAKLILPLLGTSRLITRGQVAAVISNDFDALPPGNRYFTGGDSKVRGFDFEALGPTDGTGAVIGGNRLLEASIELDQRILADWAIAAFVDAGAATQGDFATKLTSAVGLGVRWYSPIGPVQVDIATPTGGGGFRLHINLGPEL